FQAAFFRVDGEVRRITIRTGRPTRDAPAVLRLFRERLASLARPLDPGFGFDHLRLTIPVAQRLAYAQSGLEAEAPQDDLGPLIDRLSARLGPQAVVRIEPVQSHAPERAERFIAAAEALDPAGDWGERDPADPPLRP
ncbi:DNA polymerase Y family protein, partial [Rhizobium leguminosarum]|nr:DNA polymerase Y family protein [Rhizobium ruizarguesonis]